MNWKKLDDVPSEFSFRVKGGREVKNLFELAVALAGMDDETFAHHVNAEKNDFRSWVLHIVKDKELAEMISALPDRQKMAKAVESRVKQLESEKQHHKKEAEQGFKWGVREFSIGLITGLFIGLVILRALSQI